MVRNEPVPHVLRDAGRSGRNPQTGEAIEVAASKTVKISAGSKLKAIAAGKEAPPS